MRLTNVTPQRQKLGLKQRDAELLMARQHCKWSRENEAGAALSHTHTQTVWLFVQIKTSVCVLTKKHNFLVQGSRVKPARRALVLLEKAAVFTLHTQTYLGSTEVTSWRLKGFKGVKEHKLHCSSYYIIPHIIKITALCCMYKVEM